jgi:hypothetical protein
VQPDRLAVRDYSLVSPQPQSSEAAGRIGDPASSASRASEARVLCNHAIAPLQKEVAACGSDPLQRHHELGRAEPVAPLGVHGHWDVDAGSGAIRPSAKSISSLGALS